MDSILTFMDLIGSAKVNLCATVRLLHSIFEIIVVSNWLCAKIRQWRRRKWCVVGHVVSRWLFSFLHGLLAIGSWWAREPFRSKTIVRSSSCLRSFHVVSSSWEPTRRVDARASLSLRRSANRRPTLTVAAAAAAAGSVEAPSTYCLFGFPDEVAVLPRSTPILDCRRHRASRDY